jgi:hypothetical protein
MPVIGTVRQHVVDALFAGICCVSGTGPAQIVTGVFVPEMPLLYQQITSISLCRMLQVLPAQLVNSYTQTLKMALVIGNQSLCSVGR